MIADLEELDNVYSIINLTGEEGIFSQWCFMGGWLLDLAALIVCYAISQGAE